MTNLQLRIVSAVILAAIVLALTWTGGFAFRTLAAIIAAAIFYEWTMMVRPISGQPQRVVAAILLAVPLVALMAGYGGAVVFALFAAGLVLVALDAVRSRQGGWLPVGFAYAGLSGLALGLLRGDDLAGLTAILFLFAVVWATDILAYFVGRAVGGPKLAPAISPGKTWSGAIGGAVGGLVAGLAVLAWTGGASLSMALVAIVLSVVSQIGDLFESAVKRRRGVKDSSNLIPGHGGVMDRVDGLVAAALVLYLIALASGGGDTVASALFAG